MRKRLFNNRGFSLVELVVVIAIMAISSVVIVPTFIHMSQESRIKEDNIKFEAICTALKSSLSEPEVQKEMEDIYNNEPITIIFTSDAQTGEMELLKAQVAKEGVETKLLGNTVLGDHAWQWMDREYVIANKEAYGYQLTIQCTPKTYKTTAKAEIVSWEAPAASEEVA